MSLFTKIVALKLVRILNFHFAYHLSMIDDRDSQSEAVLEGNYSGGFWWKFSSISYL